MFTIYNGFTRTHVINLESRAQAESVCARSETLVFDTTCYHGTAYDLCKEAHDPW